jgi:hypothetical protein
MDYGAKQGFDAVLLANFASMSDTAIFFRDIREPER